MGEPVDVQDPVAVLGDRHEQAIRVDLLERALSQRPGGDLPREGDDRGRVRVRGGDPGDQVGGARSAGGDADARLVLGAGVPVGHVGGALLVPYEYVPDGRVHKLVVDGYDAAPGVSEDCVDALLLKHAQQCLGPSHVETSDGGTLYTIKELTQTAAI